MRVGPHPEYADAYVISVVYFEFTGTRVVFLPDHVMSIVEAIRSIATDLMALEVRQSLHYGNSSYEKLLTLKAK